MNNERFDCDGAAFFTDEVMTVLSEFSQTPHMSFEDIENLRASCKTLREGFDNDLQKWVRLVLSNTTDEYEMSIHERLCVVAASQGLVSTLSALRDKDVELSEKAWIDAASFGHLDVIKWAEENGYPWPRNTCIRAAASGGHLEVIKWLKDNGCPWDEDVCDKAAENGNLEVLKWARENGCPWDEFVCECAAENGNLEVLKWAIENGCPWAEDVWIKAGKTATRTC